MGQFSNLVATHPHTNEVEVPRGYKHFVYLPKLINTNNIYSTNVTKPMNLPQDFVLNRFKTLKYFQEALKYFYIM